jgi:transposase
MPGVLLSFFYDTIQRLMAQMGLEALLSPLLKYLITIRILEPASKLHSIELIERYFGTLHRRQNYYKETKKWIDLKDKILEKVNDFGRKEYGLDYSVVFYDVTTLYFETFEEDDLRKKGFSKDNKSQQPQILIGLIVSQEGFPLAFDIFAGNTFEGHTILPIIKVFIQKNSVKHSIVVADAAMISADNTKSLKAQSILYIVRARMGNLPQRVFEKIDT